MSELPTDYDVIVIGTGMTGSVVAAALSRVGKTVLHLDENDYYGEEWASFNMETLDAWMQSIKAPSQCHTYNENLIESNETCIPPVKKNRVSSIQQQWFCCKTHRQEHNIELNIKENIAVGDGEGHEGEQGGNPDPKDGSCPTNSRPDVEKEIPEWTKLKLKEEYRKFNLDLSPKMLYSRGAFVELLISSNIARYTEFKTVSRVLTWRNKQLEVVPCSRADVFANKHVSVVQKRMLVKILTSFTEYPACKPEFEGFEDKTFMEYLKHKKIDQQLIHYIVFAIAMGCAETPCLEGVERCQRFLQSLGRYGNTPFICPFYGSGEIPQFFCRLCAVFGGIYHLKRGVDGYILDSNGVVVAIISGGQRLNTKQIVVTSSLCPEQFILPGTQCNDFARAIYITNKSVAASEKEAITLLQFPPQELADSPVTVMEMGPSCQVCPPGLFLVHMTANLPSNSSSPEKMFSHVEEALFCKAEDEDESKPSVLWSLSWRMSPGNSTPSSACPPNFKIFPGPDCSIDYDTSIATAKDIFKQLCPEEEFLPRAPDPDEIVTDFPEETGEEEEVVLPDDGTADGTVAETNTTGTQVSNLI